MTVSTVEDIRELLAHQDIWKVKTIEGRTIGAEGAKALADALKVNQTVTTLNLALNRIGDEGAKALAEALKVNQTVTFVNLSRNIIGVEGAKALVDALKGNRTVTTVDLDGNGIGDEANIAVNSGLMKNQARRAEFRSCVGSGSVGAIESYLKEGIDLGVVTTDGCNELDRLTAFELAAHFKCLDLLHLLKRHRLAHIFYNGKVEE